ncbi:hypothetical protein niasHS_005308 [Heterodera schachtii]|uniref:Uncharacterized protein n=1 Tax=Heterodera schachtii TaxID=97005 RepID=A0ABD2J932_HETSC
MMAAADRRASGQRQQQAASRPSSASCSLSASSLLLINRCQCLPPGKVVVISGSKSAEIASRNNFVGSEQCRHRCSVRQWHAGRGPNCRLFLPLLQSVGTRRQQHTAQQPLVSLLLLFLLTISATVCPSLAQMPPFPMPSMPLPAAATNAFVPAVDANDNNDASVAAIVDAQPVEVVPAELTVDGATDDDLSTTNALRIGGVRANAIMSEAVPLLPPSVVAAARAWTKRFQYASAGAAVTHLASPPGTVPLMIGGGLPTKAFGGPAGGGTERRRKPPTIGAAGDEMPKEQQQKHGAKTMEEGAADDESDTSEAVGTARLVAMEDVDRDELSAAAPQTGAADAADQRASTAVTDYSSTNDDHQLTASSTSPTISTASSVPEDDNDSGADNVPPPPPPIHPSAASPLDDDHSPPLLSSLSGSQLAPSPISPPPIDILSPSEGPVELENPTTVVPQPSSSVGTTAATAATTADAAAGDNPSSSPFSPVAVELTASQPKLPEAAAPFPSSSSDNAPRVAAAAQRSPSAAAADSDGSINMNNEAKNTHAVGELDLKSDRELAKLMRRTTIRMHDYPTEMPSTPTASTTVNPLVVAAQLAASQAPSLFPGALPGGPFALPPPQQQQPLQSPTVHHQSSRTHQHQHQQSQQQQQQQQQQRRHSPAPRAEQFEQLGCNWDLITLSCKDLFRVGWCESCADFGVPPFVHDCRCTAVTGLYVQTASFLGSAAAAARANAALTANQSATSGGGTSAAAVPPPVAWPMFPLLPTLGQLGPPLLEAPGGANAGTALPRAATAELQQQLLLANALRFPPQPLPQIGQVPTAAGSAAAGLGLVPLGVGGAQTAQLAAVPLAAAVQQQQQQQLLINRQQQQQWDMMTPVLLASPVHRHTDSSALNGPLFSSPQLSAAQFALRKLSKRRR